MPGLKKNSDTTINTSLLETDDPNTSQEEQLRFTAKQVAQLSNIDIDRSWPLFWQKLLAGSSVSIEPLFAYYLFDAINPALKIWTKAILNKSSEKVQDNAAGSVGYPLGGVLAGLNLASDMALFVPTVEAEDSLSATKENWLRKELNKRLKAGTITEKDKERAIAISYALKGFANIFGWFIGASADAIAIALLTDSTAAQVVLGLLVTVLGTYYYNLGFNKKLDTHLVSVLFDLKKGLNLITENPVKGFEFLLRVNSNAIFRGISFGYILLQLLTTNFGVSESDPILSVAVGVTVFANFIITQMTRTLGAYSTILSNARDREDEIFMIKMLNQETNLTEEQIMALLKIAEKADDPREENNIKKDTEILEAVLKSRENLLNNDRLQEILSQETPLAEQNYRLLVSLKDKISQKDETVSDPNQETVPVVDHREQLREKIEKQERARTYQKKLLNQIAAKMQETYNEQQPILQSVNEKIKEKSTNTSISLEEAIVLMELAKKQEGTLSEDKKSTLDQINDLITDLQNDKILSIPEVEELISKTKSEKQPKVAMTIPTAENLVSLAKKEPPPSLLQQNGNLHEEKSFDIQEKSSSHSSLDDSSFTMTIPLEVAKFFLTQAKRQNKLIQQQIMLLQKIAELTEVPEQIDEVKYKTIVQSFYEWFGKVFCKIAPTSDKITTKKLLKQAIEEKVNISFKTQPLNLVFNKSIDAILVAARSIPVGYLLQVALQELMGNYALAISIPVGLATAAHNWEALKQIANDTQAMNAADLIKPKAKLDDVDGDVATTFQNRVKDLEENPTIKAIALLCSGGGRIARLVAFFWFVTALTELFHDQHWTPEASFGIVLALTALLGILNAFADAPVFDQANRSGLALHYARGEYAGKLGEYTTEVTDALYAQYYQEFESFLAKKKVGHGVSNVLSATAATVVTRVIAPTRFGIWVGRTNQDIINMVQATQEKKADKDPMATGYQSPNPTNPSTLAKLNFISEQNGSRPRANSNDSQNSERSLGRSDGSGDQQLETLNKNPNNGENEHEEEDLFNRTHQI